MNLPQQRWYSELNRYQWWVLVVATLGWLFDTMDQRLFVLARSRALEELLGAQATPESVKYLGSIATAMMLIGWATGGLIFGTLGDRLGRVKTLMLTVGTYSLFTGLSGLSLSPWDFILYRFLTGLGVGGAFGAAVTLVAEEMPTRARPHALGSLQALSAVGNIVGSLVGLVLLPVTIQMGWAALADGAIHGWRLMFFVGALPALLVVLIMTTLREPQAWVAARQAAREAALRGEPTVKLGSWQEMWSDRRWRNNTLIGVWLVLVGAVGLWAIGFWSPELIRGHVLAQYTKEYQDRVSSIATALQDVGAFFGVMAYTWITAHIGRRKAFALSFLLAFLVTAGIFGFMNQEWQIYLATPLLGFATLAPFGGYAIYLPELYPTRLRSTGTGFCYNVARYLTAAGVFFMGSLTVLFASLGFEEPFRWATVSVALIYLGGLAVLPIAPETKDQPLPE
jgi:MFS family permease